MKMFKKSSNKLEPFNPISAKNIQNNREAKRQELEKQFYKTFRNFLIIYQIFISAPVGLHKPISRDLRKSRSGLIFYRLHIMWCLSLYSVLLFCIYEEYTLSNIELPTVQKPLYCSEYLIYLIHLSEFARMITFRRETFWKFHTFILDFDCSLLDVKARTQYDDLRRFLRQHIALILLHLITCAIIGYFYNDCKVLSFLRTNTIYILPNVIINISLLQYYVLLFIVYKRGEKLYFLLERLFNGASSNDVLNFRQRLNLIRTLFAKLDKFTKTINDHFSISICLVYFGSFINICLNIFLMYKHFNAWDSSIPAWTIYSLAWTCMHIGKMLLILYYNQKVQNMKNKATLLISSFKFEYQGAETTLRLFLLQLMSDTRSNYICGMAPLDMNCIISLLAGISTLFIFLVQYDITNEALTNN